MMSEENNINVNIGAEIVGKCDHRIGSKKTTIILTKDEMCMVYPQTIWGMCHICGKTFKYQRGDDGRFTRVPV